MSVEGVPGEPTDRGVETAWIASFIRRFGRLPRILHIGNIANNAYNVAKLLREYGLDCDVICYDYYHIMGCPEWEDGDIDAIPHDQFRPFWVGAVSNFERPRWFVQGPTELCLDYLLARGTGRTAQMHALWKRLAAANGTSVESRKLMRLLGGLAARMRPSAAIRYGGKYEQLLGKLALHIRFSACEQLLRKLMLRIRFSLPGQYCEATLGGPRPYFRIWRKLGVWLPGKGMSHEIARATALGLMTPFVFVGRFAFFFLTVTLRLLGFVLTVSLRILGFVLTMPLRVYRFVTQRHPSGTPSDLRSEETWPARVGELVRRFSTIFPERPDALRSEDAEIYGSLSFKWKAVMEHYDLVQAYSTDPILPLLIGKRPYVGFEHGTLRDFTLADDGVSRLTALGYNQADHVFITNGDCLDYARRIGVTRYSAMLHPIDERNIRALPPLTGELRARYGVKHIFLCTLRHDWAVKGTDKYIRALPAITEVIGTDFKLLMTRWGAGLAASIDLARELGVEDRIAWIDPLPKRTMVRTQKSVDVVFDQIALPHFGSTAPETIAAGVPVIMSYDPRSTAWLVEEPAPILSAWSVEEIVSAVKLALDPEWLADYRRRADEWIERCHNARRVVGGHLSVYERLIGSALEANTARKEAHDG